MLIKLEDALAQWRRWGVATEPLITKHFQDGLNHTTCLIDVAGEALVVKLFTAPSTLAIKAQQWAAEIGIAPNLVYVDRQFRYVVMRYTDAGSLRDSWRATEQNLAALAKGLTQMHTGENGQRSTAGFDIGGFCESYLVAAGDKAQRIHQTIIPLIDEYKKDQTPWCYCHNDLVAANCFITEGTAQFIDWEYADWHNPWFDIAAIIYYLRLDRAQAEVLLGNYKEGWQNYLDSRIFFTSQVVLLWGDMLWHLAKFGESYWSELTVKYDDLNKLLNSL